MNGNVVHSIRVVWPPIVNRGVLDGDSKITSDALTEVILYNVPIRQTLIIRSSANDRPYLDLQTCPTGAADQMCIRLNENEEHEVNLRSDTQDQDVQNAWKCCDTTAPYAFTKYIYWVKKDLFGLF